MNRPFELAKIEGAVTVASIEYTIVDGIHDTVEYRLILSQGVNSEWRNLFQREWDRATAPTSVSFVSAVCSTRRVSLLRRS